jgi:hypothetical protein
MPIPGIKYFIVLMILIVQVATTTIGQNMKWLPQSENNCEPREFRELDTEIHGKTRLLVCQYEGSVLSRIFNLTHNNLKIQDTEWKYTVTGTSNLSGQGLMDFTVTFKLVKGEMKSTGVAIAFDLDDWNSENYTMIPAAVYNSNRNKTERRGYCTGFDPGDFYNKNIPQITTELPQLSPIQGEASSIEVSSCNAATPAVCILNRRNKRAFIALSEQGIRKEGQILDNGFIIAENKEHTKASLVVSAPGVRSRKPQFIGFGDSPDRALDWKTGDEISIHLRIYSFEAFDVPGLLEKFMTIRKDVTGSNHPRNLVPFSEVKKIMTGQIDKRWLEKSDFQYYCPENSDKICIGWIGGLMNTFPMIALNDNMHRDRVTKTFDFVMPAIAGKSGYFLAAMNPNGRASGRDWFPNQPIVLTRQNADALYWMLKQFMVLKVQGNFAVIKPIWEQTVEQLAQAFVKTWKKSGQWGNYINHETGEIAVYNTTSGAMAIGGLVLASKWFENPEFLSIAKEAAEYYYLHDFVQKGFTYGACSDILQNADSETSAGLMTSLMAVYEATGEKKWMEMCRNVANLTATWVVSYDYELPKETELARLGAKLTGAVWASTQNKHGAPGFCTLSGDPLFKIFRNCGDIRYADLMRDVVHAWAEGIKPGGEITERLTYCDADNRGSRGGSEFGSTGWNELNGILMAMELPGIYLQTNSDKFYVFDHIEAKVTDRSENGIILQITNPTKYDANVTIFAEESAQSKEPMDCTAFLNWPFVFVKAGKTMNLSVLPNGQLKL